MLLDCPIIETSALRGEGLDKLIDEAVKVAKSSKVDLPKEIFSKDMEAAIDEVKVFFLHLLQMIRRDGMRLSSLRMMKK